MKDPIHPLVALEFALTVMLVALLFVTAFRAASTGVTPWSLVRRARRLALLLFAVALGGATLHRCLTRDWVHFDWSLAYPMFGLSFGSGAFLCSAWTRDREDERTQTGRAHDFTRSGWWFPAAAVTLGLWSIVLQLVLPGPVPPTRTFDGTVLGLVGIAAHGLGLGPLPPVLEVVSPQGAARGMGYLTHDLTVSIGTLTLAAQLLVAYVALALVLRLPTPRGGAAGGLRARRGVPDRRRLQADDLQLGRALAVGSRGHSPVRTDARSRRRSARRASCHLGLRSVGRTSTCRR